MMDMSEQHTIIYIIYDCYSYIYGICLNLRLVDRIRVTDEKDHISQKVGHP